MAGKNQHYIPRLLLRGFKIPGQAAELVVRYRQGLPALQVSIDTICRDKYFYSDATDTRLDDEITQEESDVFGPALDAVRKGNAADEPTLRRFLVHLMLRTKAARTTMDGVAKAAGQGLIDAVGDKDGIEAKLTSGEFDVAGIAEKALDEQLAKAQEMRAQSGLPPLPISPELRAGILAMANRFSQQNLSGLAAFVAASAKAPGIRSLMEERLSGERIQKNALSSDVAPPKRVANLDGMTLSIVDYDQSTPLVLGDDAVLGFRADGALVRPVLPLDPPSTLVLPVTPTRALTFSNCPIDFLHSARFVNEATAVMSHEQFVGQTFSPDFASLIGRIGTYRDPIDDVNWKDVASGRRPPG